MLPCKVLLASNELDTLPVFIEAQSRVLRLGDLHIDWQRRLHFYETIAALELHLVTQLAATERCGCLVRRHHHILPFTAWLLRVSRTDRRRVSDHRILRDSHRFAVVLSSCKRFLSHVERLLRVEQLEVTRLLVVCIRTLCSLRTIYRRIHGDSVRRCHSLRAQVWQRHELLLSRLHRAC